MDQQTVTVCQRVVQDDRTTGCFRRKSGRGVNDRAKRPTRRRVHVVGVWDDDEIHIRSDKDASAFLGHIQTAEVQRWRSSGDEPGKRCMGSPKYHDALAKAAGECATDSLRRFRRGLLPYAVLDCTQ
jgi:hypothetical protein